MVRIRFSIIPTAHCVVYSTSPSHYYSRQMSVGPKIQDKISSSAEQADFCPSAFHLLTIRNQAKPKISHFVATIKSSEGWQLSGENENKPIVHCSKSKLLW